MKKESENKDKADDVNSAWIILARILLKKLHSENDEAEVSLIDFKG